jgi:hypothetical protein
MWTWKTGEPATRSGASSGGVRKRKMSVRWASWLRSEACAAGGRVAQSPPRVVWHTALLAFYAGPSWRNQVESRTLAGCCARAGHLGAELRRPQGWNWVHGVVDDPARSGLRTGRRGQREASASAAIAKEERVRLGPRRRPGGRRAPPVDVAHAGAHHLRAASAPLRGAHWDRVPFRADFLQ